MTKRMEEILTKLREVTQDITSWALLESVSRTAIEAKIASEIVPILDELFTTGRQWSEGFMESEFVKANKKWDLKLKFDKDVLLRYQDQNSIFQGYYDTNYQAEFTKREIDTIKRKILTAKYAQLPEEEAIQLVQSAANVTTNRARLLWRYENTKLASVAKQIYYEDGLKDEYEKVWVSKHDSVVRPDHEAMDGKKADSKGYFDTPNGKTLGPPYPGSYNCRCSVKFIKKS